MSTNFNFLSKCCKVTANLVFSVNNNVYMQRKTASNKQTPSRPKNQKMNDPSTMPVDYQLDDSQPSTEPVGQKPKRPKRLKKSVNEKFEDGFAGTSTLLTDPTTQFPPPSDFNYGDSKSEMRQDT